MKKIKKIFAVVLAMVMLMSMLPVVSASAESYQALELNEVTQVSVTEDGILYTFTPKEDGFYKFYSMGDSDPYAILYDSNWNELDYCDDYDMNDYNFVVSAKLFKDNTYYFYLGAYLDDGEYAQFEICVEETVGVESIEVTQEPYDSTVIADYEYESIELTGLELLITYSDGAEVSWAYGDDEYLGDYYVNIYWYYDEYGDFCVEIDCGSCVVYYYMTLVESPVESIEYVCDTPIEYYVESNGFISDESYVYFWEVPEEAFIIINYKDGTSEQVDYYDEDYYFGAYDSQHEQTFVVGSDNYITISYFGAEVDVPVTILPCPFKSVTLNSAPTKDYIFGDHSTGYIDQDGEYFFWLSDLTGLSFTVEYHDGTKETYTDEDVDMYLWEIDGYCFDVSSHEVIQAGTVDGYVSYKGAKIEFPVNVVESHIESVEVLSPPTKAEYEMGYYADFTGAVFKLNYKDGTSATVTADSTNMSYSAEGEFVCEIRVGDDVIYIYNRENMEDEYCMYDYITCAGAGLDYYGITYTEDKAKSQLSVENFSMSGEGMVLNFEYTDGSTDKLTLDPVCYDVKEDGFTDGYALTENGILNFTIEKAGSVYYIHALGEVDIIDASENSDMVLGDVDGDGEVSVLDATAIQIYIAKLDKLSEDALSRADTDGDGEVSVLDATQIQLYIAKLIPEL